jgi:hypothetical protein
MELRGNIWPSFYDDALLNPDSMSPSSQFPDEVISDYTSETPHDGTSALRPVTRHAKHTVPKYKRRKQTKPIQLSRCPFDECDNVTFGRYQDLKRHHGTFHVESAIWCPAYDCPRNVEYGDYPFPRIRLDKLRKHIRNIHNSDEEKMLWPMWFQEMKSTRSIAQG